MPDVMEAVPDGRSYDHTMNAPAAAPESRPGLQAANEAVELPLPELVGRLRVLVGARLVAYVGNASTTLAVSKWANGEQPPAADDEARLRLAFHVARLMSDQHDTATIQSWLMGSNPSLDGEAPARYVRARNPVVAAREIVAAALSYTYAE